MRVGTLRKTIGAAGIAALGGALAYAPVAAFIDDMTLVSRAGLAGVVLLLIARLLPRDAAERSEPQHPGEG